MVAKNERPVLITTAHRGVFFGYATDTSGDTVKIKRGRCCVYWTAEVKGFVGLAATGPITGCRIGPPADMELRNVTAILECTEESAAAWESGKWK